MATLVAATSCLAACQLDVVLVGEQSDDGREDAVVDSVVDVVVDDAGGDAVDEAPEDAGADAPDGEPEDATVDGEDVPPPPCPIFASAVGGSGTPDGSRDRPYTGLQAAVDARGGCGHIVLLPDAGGAPFAARVDVVLPAGGTLLIEGDPSAAERVELRAVAGESGIAVTGEGTLQFRHLAVRSGTATSGSGGCLHAEVGTLLVEDTAWAGCSSGWTGGAIWVRAGRIEVARSDFSGNRADWDGGALAVAGSAETSLIVEEVHFAANDAAGGTGGAIDITAPTLDSLVVSSWFVRNHSGSGGAMSGYLGGTIKGNRFEVNSADEGAGALSGNGGWYLAEILQNVFVGNSGGRSAGGSASAGAIQLESPFLAVRNNLFVRNRGVGGEAGAVDVPWGNPVVVNNSFIDNDNGDGAAAHLHVMDGDMRSNVFVRGVGEHAVCAHPHEVDEPPRGYNDVWSIPPFADCWEEDASWPGSLAADPRFIDPDSDDYRLGPDSPCIDAGVPDDTFRDPDGSRNDMGAFGGPQGDWTPLPADGGP